MNELTKTDNIKQEFVLYEYSSMLLSKTVWCVLDEKYKYLLSQYEKYQKTIRSLEKFVKIHTSLGDIPERYCLQVRENRKFLSPYKFRLKIERLTAQRRKEMKRNDVYFDVQDFKKHTREKIYSIIERYPIREIRLKESLTSLIRTKYKKEKEIIRMFDVLFNNNDGQDFDEYIDNWTKQLLNEMM